MTDAGRSLAGWGEALRAARAKRRRLCWRAGAVGALVLAVGLTMAAPVRPLLVWNASASAPVGLYAVSAPDDLRTGDMVITQLSAPMHELAARRRYLPANVPLVKRVAAEPGDQVCARGRTVFIEGKPVSERRSRDGFGRRMPRWTGCVTLRRGALFLLMDGSPASFDGRYFGPTERGLVVGKARLLWAR